MPGKNSTSKKSRRSTRSTRVIKDLPPRGMTDQEKRQVKGGAPAMSDIPITKYVDKSSPKL
jgi:type VI protein secretion system component Hcp